ncbi:MAG: hypothetical protein SGBAC_008346 [Bacillariaceae sp.]
MKEYCEDKLGMLTIQRNNSAVSMLRRGRTMNAFHLLSKACRDVQAARKGDDRPSYQRTYQYTWLDCSKALTTRMEGAIKFNEGTLPFLFLHFLRIKNPLECSEEDGSICARGFVWVLWYNLALVSILLGSPVGAPGIGLLKQSLGLFRLVQSVVDPQPSSKHWLILKLSILNNEACVHSELAQSYESLDRLINMGLELSKMSDMLDPKEQELFLWTVKVMVDDRYAPAA